MSVRFRGLTPLVNHMPLFPVAVSKAEAFARSKGLALLGIEVQQRAADSLLITEVALIATVEGGDRFGIGFAITHEQLLVAYRAMQDAARKRRKAWHDWQN